MSDIFDEMEQQEVKVHSTKGRNSGGIIRFEYTDEDSDLMVLLKDLVNNAEITYNDVYDKFDRRLGWNMIHSIRKGQISWERFKKWTEVLDVEAEIIIKPKK